MDFFAEPRNIVQVAGVGLAAMADYYPVLARAISGLPSDDPQARRALYARARTIVTEQLRSGGHAATVEVLREQAALEAAIGRIEAEALTARLSLNGKTAAPPAGRRVAIAPVERRVENTARSLSKILHAVQSEDTQSAGAPQQKAVNGATALSPAAESGAVVTSDDRNKKAASALGTAPSSLGTMLFDLTYVVAAFAFTAVIYIRCSVWVYQGIISTPIMLGVMAFTLALFVAPPAIIFRRTSRLPTIDMVLRFIHATSRRML